MSAVDNVTLVVTTVDNRNFPNPTNGNEIQVVNSIGQVVGALVGVFKIGTGNIPGINAVTGFVLAVKVNGDIGNNRDVSLGDALSLVASGVTIAAGIAVVVGAGPATMGYFAALGLVGAASSLLANELNLSVNDLYNAAINWRPPCDPLALDLDGDGIETRGADGTVLFDFNGDGIKTGTGWVKPDDGFLVLN